MEDVSYNSKLFLYYKKNFISEHYLLLKKQAQVPCIYFCQNDSKTDLYLPHVELHLQRHSSYSGGPSG